MAITIHQYLFLVKTNIRKIKNYSQTKDTKRTKKQIKFCKVELVRIIAIIITNKMLLVVENIIIIM